MAHKDVSNYQELIDFMSKHNGVAILAFHSPCTPCRLIAPHLSRLHALHPIPLATANVDKAEDLNTKFNVHAIPTYILVKKVAGDIQIVQTVYSAHLDKLTRLFETAVEMKGSKK